ncbi:MAG: dipeptidase PepE [Acidobacteriota bacterium]|nr:dipeptidase PepE [Acidobacteriota bacterium]
MSTPNLNNRLLLISNSTLFGSGFLDHAEPEIRDFLKDISRVLFVPFALHDLDGYADKVSERLIRMGYNVDSLHRFSDKQQAVRGAEAIFVGGGNTFRLLKSLYDFDVLKLIRSRVAEGLPYIGSSAGSNIAAPTIRTTNDMPIVEPPSLNALGLVGFQINPHYLDPNLSSTHMGETREERILQFLEENDTPVVALREGAMLRVEAGSTTLKGSTGACIFRKGQTPLEIKPGTKLDEIL